MPNRHGFWQEAPAAWPMIAPGRLREIELMIETTPPGEMVALDKTTARALVDSVHQGMLARCELIGLEESKHRSSQREVQACPV